LWWLVEVEVEVELDDLNDRVQGLVCRVVVKIVEDNGEGVYIG
jgi:hypothetical protein